MSSVFFNLSVHCVITECVAFCEPCCIYHHNQVLNREPSVNWQNSRWQSCNCRGKWQIELHSVNIQFSPFFYAYPAVVGDLCWKASDIISFYRLTVDSLQSQLFRLTLKCFLQKFLTFHFREWIWRNYQKLWGRTVLSCWEFSSCTADKCWMFLQVPEPLWPMGGYWDHWSRRRSLLWMTSLSWRGIAWTAMGIRSCRHSRRQQNIMLMVMHVSFCFLYEFLITSIKIMM